MRYWKNKQKFLAYIFEWHPNTYNIYMCVCVCVIKFQTIVRQVYQAKMVRQRRVDVYSIKLHHVGHGTSEHSTGQYWESVFGLCQLRFHRSVCARDVCQSKQIVIFLLPSINGITLCPVCLYFFFFFVSQVVAAGMFYGTEPYFQSGWNIMDGLLVVVSIIDLLMSLISESSPKIFGILRVSLSIVCYIAVKRCKQISVRRIYSLSVFKNNNFHHCQLPHQRFFSLTFRFVNTLPYTNQHSTSKLLDNCLCKLCTFSGI